MKSLYDYIIESTEETEEQTEKTQDDVQSFKFDFSKFENPKETIESIISQIEDFVSDSDDKTITIECKNSDASKVQGALEILKSYIKKNGESTKRASDEQYAQFCQSQERKLNEFEQFLKPVENPKPTPEESEEEKQEKENKEDKEEK